ncbi:hypothetical protein L6452_41986 [Arctium lappa]|uniref:Uncharacterized protein n=1 Tax=Arctium lappa TaxID=4217 RepID=A0ACB8XIS7_ARCLA|nr:hypothetical protein L6452_41986 [Arctium lappa]
MASQTTLIKLKNVKFDIAASQLTPNNYLALVDFSNKKPSPHLQYADDFLKDSSIAYALKVAPPASRTLLQLFWYTAEKIQVTTRFLDLMGYQWDFKPRTNNLDKKLTKILKEKMPSELNYILTHIIQCLTGKMGSLDQASKVQLQMGFSVVAGRHIDYATNIFEDLLSKVEKAERELKIPYVRSLTSSLLPTSFVDRSSTAVPSTTSVALTTDSVLVESLSTSLNTNKSVVNTAGAELKTLSSAVSTKVEASQLSALEEEAMSLKTNVDANSTQLQSLNGHVDNLTREAKALSGKINSSNQLLAEILAKLKAPAPEPEPSFTDDDRMSLTLTADFVIGATSLIPEIEDRLKALEDDAWKTSVDDSVVATVNTSPVDHDKEGEKDLEEENAVVNIEVVTNEPPPHVEGEKTAEELAVTPPSSSLVIMEEEIMKKKMMNRNLIWKINVPRMSSLMMMTTRRIHPYGSSLRQSLLQPSDERSRNK